MQAKDAMARTVAKEKGRESVTDGIPPALPALVHAGKVISRSAALVTMSTHTPYSGVSCPVKIPGLAAI